MNKIDYHKMIVQLKDANIKNYDLDDFKDFCLTEEEWNGQKSKRERALRRTYIVVYGTFKKRLLARTFYLEEGFCRKEGYTFLTEVERQLAGCPFILTKRLYTMMGSQGFRVWKGTDEKGWQINRQGTHEIYGLYSNWTGETYSYVEDYNDWRPFLKKSIHKYSAYELIPEKEQDNNYMFTYLSKYEKHPQIEMLVKLGMFHLLKDDLRYIKWTKKGPAMLGITKQEVKYLQAGITIPNYRKVREIVLKYALSVEECNKAVELYDVGVFDARAVKYAAANNLKASDYRDYLGFLNQLGVPLQPKYLYPSDFKEAHDQRMVEVSDKKDELINKAIEKYAEDLEDFIYHEHGLTIIPARSQGELIAESLALNHCVRTYADRVSKRQTAIFFIREEEHEKTPFVTLELQNKKVVQCRAKNNNKPDDMVVDFVNTWCEKNHLKTCFS